MKPEMVEEAHKRGINISDVAREALLRELQYRWNKEKQNQKEEERLCSSCLVK